MTTYTIDKENNFTAFASPKEVQRLPEVERFRSAKELARLAQQWPAARLVEIWNALPGVVPVNKFTSRKTAVVRIWTAIQNLAPDTGAQRSGVAPHRRRSTRAANPKTKAPTARDSSKKAGVLALLRREGGASLQELMSDTGWQAHSVRGFLSATIGKKMGLTLQSVKREDGARFYSIAG